MSQSPLSEDDLKEIFSLFTALRETLRELGIEEFQTRTGFEFEKGEMVLKKLNRLLGEARTT